MLREIRIKYEPDGKVQQYVKVKTVQEVFDRDGNSIGVARGGHMASIEVETMDLDADPLLSLSADERVTVTEAITEAKRGRAIFPDPVPAEHRRQE